jgi:hypothetical protein
VAHAAEAFLPPLPTDGLVEIVQHAGKDEQPLSSPNSDFLRLWTAASASCVLRFGHQRLALGVV